MTIANHRTVGDIDTYNLGSWQTVGRIVSEYFGIVIDIGYEHHTCFSYKGVMIENHYDFINVKAYKDSKIIEDKLSNWLNSIIINL